MIDARALSATRIILTDILIAVATMHDLAVRDSPNCQSLHRLQNVNHTFSAHHCTRIAYSEPSRTRTYVLSAWGPSGTGTSAPPSGNEALARVVPYRHTTTTGLPKPGLAWNVAPKEIYDQSITRGNRPITVPPQKGATIPVIGDR